MAKKKTVNNSAQVVEPYVPKLDTHLYVYIRKDIRKLNPIPYKWNPNFQYLIPLL